MRMCRESNDAHSHPVSQVLRSQRISVRANQRNQIRHCADNFASFVDALPGLDQLGVEVLVLEGQTHFPGLGRHFIAVFLLLGVDRLQAHKTLGIATGGHIALNGDDLAGVQDATRGVGFDL
jgi:hypothetical protein